MPNDSEALRHLRQADTRGDSSGAPPVRSFLVPGLTVLHHPDSARVGERALLAGLGSGREEALSRLEPLFRQPEEGPARPLADLYLSRKPLRLVPGKEGIRLLREDGGTVVAVQGETMAAERLLTAEEMARGVVFLLANRVVVLLSLLDPVVVGIPSFGLVGSSAALLHLRQEIRRVAGLEVAVLLRGETGTGKELVARALHDASPRAGRPYVALNMAAVPPQLAAAELFGAARGAFTGADRQRDGHFQKAGGGTLFLDEVGEMPPEVQALLLRALESGEVQPVGGDAPRRVDVRLIAATDADLEDAVDSGRFRAPLLHRLGVYEIRLPPLRERRDDVGRLFYHFLRRQLAALGEEHRLETPAEERPWVPAALVARLATLDWPGNVRQLKNLAQRVALAGRDSGEPGMWLQVERLLDESGRREMPVVPVPPKEPAPEARKAYRSPEEVTEAELIEALRANRWRLQRVAAQLGMSRGSLYDKIDRSPNIRKAADLTREEIEACRVRCGGDLDAMVEGLEVSLRGLRRRMSQLGMA